jgi:hypothetical protein
MHLTEASCLPVMVVVTAGRGRGPLKALPTPLVVAFNTPLGVVSGDIGPCLLVTSRGYLPASLCRTKHDRLVTGSVLGGDAALLLKRVHQEVSTSTLPRAPCVALRHRTLTTMVSLAARLGITTPILPPWWA